MSKESSSNSPSRGPGAPALMESPDSILGRPYKPGDEDDDPLLELDELESSFHDDYHEERLHVKIQNLVVWLQQAIQDRVSYIWSSKQERRRYSVGGVVLLYMLFMYFCSWTVPPNYGTCPAHDEALLLSVPWRLSRAPRPPATCGLDPELEAFLEKEQEKGEVFVRLNQPVTFLNNRHRRATTNGRNETLPPAPNTTAHRSKVGPRGNLHSNGSRSVADPRKGKNDDARWVSLHHGRRAYNPIVAVWRFILRRLVNPRLMSDDALLKSIEGYTFPHAFTLEPLLSDEDMDFLEAWSDRLTDKSPDWYRRVAKVAWGGKSKWWHPVFPRSSYYPLETIDGANLLYPYYQAMQPYMRDEGHVRFPRRQCASGCNTQAAILSTLEWRESYTPWMVTPEVLEENADGWVYARGISKPSPYGRHGLVWLRVGQHTVKDKQAYARAIVQSVDQAVGESLRHGRVGRVNVVIEADGYEWGKIPDIHEIKNIFGILQDHYPGKFGAAFLCNMSPSAEILFSILKPLIGKDVLDKIYVMPLNPEERNKQLETVVPAEHIPTWLGGSDSYQFNARKYYSSRFIMNT